MKETNYLLEFVKPLDAGEPLITPVIPVPVSDSADNSIEASCVKIDSSPKPMVALSSTSSIVTTNTTGASTVVSVKDSIETCGAARSQTSVISLDHFSPDSTSKENIPAPAIAAKSLKLEPLSECMSLTSTTFPTTMDATESVSRPTVSENTVDPQLIAATLSSVPPPPSLTLTKLLAGPSSWGSSASSSSSAVDSQTAFVPKLSPGHQSSCVVSTAAHSTTHSHNINTTNSINNTVTTTTTADEIQHTSALLVSTASEPPENDHMITANTETLPAHTSSSSGLAFASRSQPPLIPAPLMLSGSLALTQLLPYENGSGLLTPTTQSTAMLPLLASPGPSGLYTPGLLTSLCTTPTNAAGTFSLLSPASSALLTTGFEAASSALGSTFLSSPSCYPPSSNVATTNGTLLSGDTAGLEAQGDTCFPDVNIGSGDTTSRVAIKPAPTPPSVASSSSDTAHLSMAPIGSYAPDTTVTDDTNA
ncbi:unnamed protein product, partial [Echinostoma caproni]|uniref:Uncharacterized protein n=1 Tax=Echinostoma caproni TaxID=27848 RepID=A0A183AKE3_9TREM